MDGIKYTPGDLVDHAGIAAVIRDAHGRVLVQDHIKYGFWTIPVGKAEHGQSPQDALCQEVSEECDIVVEEFHESVRRLYHYVRDGKPVTMTLHLFVVDRWSGDVRNAEPHKHREICFMTLEEIRHLPYLSDATLLLLETLGYPRPAKIDGAL